MSADKDIVEELNESADGHDLAYSDESIDEASDLMRKAAAEIVRLRGEVATERAAAGHWMREANDEHNRNIRLQAIAPAEAKGDAQPADGEAVARDPYAPTDGELLAEFIRICREHKPVGQWPGERVCAAIERLMANQKPFRFIAEGDMAPEREHNGRGGDADRMTSGPRRAARPSACELGVVREALEAAARSLRTIADQAGKTEGLDDMMNVRGYANSQANVAELALQHRGDSRGGEG